MKKRKMVNWKLAAGILILLVIIISYFITITGTEQEGSITYETRTQLLGIIIYYNPFILWIYVLIAVILIVKGVKEDRKGL